MEEADALSDRIAIINHGEVKCYGSPWYLKKTFASNYKLTVYKAENFNEKALIDTIRKYINNFTIETNIKCEISILIPREYSNKLLRLLNKIENSKKDFGLSSYGINSSTIEDVFVQ